MISPCQPQTAAPASLRLLLALLALVSFAAAAAAAEDAKTCLDDRHLRARGCPAPTSAPTGPAAPAVAATAAPASPKPAAPASEKEFQGLLNLGNSLTDRGDFPVAEIAFRRFSTKARRRSRPSPPC